MKTEQKRPPNSKRLDRKEAENLDRFSLEILELALQMLENRKPRSK